MKICSNGHLTGYRNCGTCGSKHVRHVSGLNVPATDKKQKRAIDRAILDAGGIPERIRRRQ